MFVSALNCFYQKVKALYDNKMFNMNSHLKKPKADLVEKQNLYRRAFLLLLTLYCFLVEILLPF